MILLKGCCLSEHRSQNIENMRNYPVVPTSKIDWKGSHVYKYTVPLTGHYWLHLRKNVLQGRKLHLSNSSSRASCMLPYLWQPWCAKPRECRAYDHAAADGDAQKLCTAQYPQSLLSPVRKAASDRTRLCWGISPAQPGFRRLRSRSLRDHDAQWCGPVVGYLVGYSQRDS